MRRSTRVQALRVRACVWPVDAPVGGECLAVCGFVDVGAFVCLQALLGMSACTFTRVCVTSHLRPVQKQEDAFWWHVEAPGSRPPVATTTHLFSLFSFLSIFKY